MRQSSDQDSNVFNTQRVENNIKALRSLYSKQPRLDTLKSYSGWGGLRKAIYTPGIFWRLKQIISDEAFQSIKKTLKTAYFTPHCLVDFIYQCLSSLIHQPCRILEPSAGLGVFIERMPESFRKAYITAIEMDQINSCFLKALYPHIAVQCKGFETFGKNASFDLIVGNPPFGQYYVADTIHKDITCYSIHHYFVAKAMRLLKPNGVLAMILPRYFMDNSRKHVRALIKAEGGSLIAAYRLPDSLFDDATVTIDIVFLRKNTGSVDWIEAKPIKDGDKQAFMNQYFFDHPHHILGTIEFIEIYGRHEITCTAQGDLSSLLACAMDRFQRPVPDSQSLSFLTCQLSNAQSALAQLVTKKSKLERLHQDIQTTQDKLMHLYAQAKYLLGFDV